jgi:hypothetical protein
MRGAIPLKGLAKKAGKVVAHQGIKFGKEALRSVAEKSTTSDFGRMAARLGGNILDTVDEKVLNEPRAGGKGTGRRKRRPPKSIKGSVKRRRMARPKTIFDDHYGRGTRVYKE